MSLAPATVLATGPQHAASETHAREGRLRDRVPLLGRDSRVRARLGRTRLARGVRRAGSAFHRFSLRHGMTVGTGLIVAGVGASVGLYGVGQDHAAEFAAIVPPLVGVKMNLIGLGAQLHDSYHGAQGKRIARIAHVVRERSDAVGVKLWSTGVKFLGLGLVATHGSGGEGHFGALGASSIGIGAALAGTGLAMHVVPRVVRLGRPIWNAMNRTDALGVKLWALGAAFMGTSVVASHGLGSKGIFGAINAGAIGLGVALAGAGVGMHVVPRAVRLVTRRTGDTNVPPATNAPENTDAPEDAALQGKSTREATLNAAL